MRSERRWVGCHNASFDAPDTMWPNVVLSDSNHKQTQSLQRQCESETSTSVHSVTRVGSALGDSTVGPREDVGQIAELYTFACITNIN